jgi:ParB family transcriptional regulator, chromosome partitioning protein
MIMARKNVLSGLLSESDDKFTAVNSSAHEPTAGQRSSSGYKGVGALGAVTRSIDALAAKADAAKAIEAKLTAGEVVIELDPDVIEDSFVSDRLVQLDAKFDELVEAIRLRGQDSPILVRPHPSRDGKYQIAFGHRRARVAKVLGRPVRAVVKKLDDRDHVIAQGQENSARADLSFIERAMFAGRLEQRAFDRETIMAALSADKTTVSKMLSVINRIPTTVVAAIGPALAVGRDRWHDLARRFDAPENAARAKDFIAQPQFVDAVPDERFDLLSACLAGRSEAKASVATMTVSEWQGDNGAVKADIRAGGKKFTIALKAENGRAFGAYITKNLDRLYLAFQDEKKLAAED